MGRKPRKYHSCLLVDKFSGLVVRHFDTEMEAAQFSNIRYHSLMETLRNKQVSPGRFIYRYPEDYKSNEMLDNRSAPIIVRDLNGTYSVYDSVTKASKKYGISANMIYKHIKNREPIIGRYFAYCNRLGEAEYLQCKSLEKVRM